MVHDFGQAPFPNSSDLRLFADRYLETMQIFNESIHGRAILRRKVRDALCDGAKGDFIALDLKLREIKACGSEQGIEEVLGRANESRMATTGREIERLNSSLQVYEIQEINAILPWVMDAFKGLSIRQYDEILSLRPTRQSLMPLEAQINGSYSTLFYVNVDNHVELTTTEVGDYLKHPELHSQDTTLHPAEISMIQHLIKTQLKNLLGSEEGRRIYTRYRFDEFFQSRSKDTQVDRILLPDRSTNDVEIARVCLQAMCADAQSLPRMQEYAYQYFAKHLSRCDRRRLDLPTRRKIIELIVICLRRPRPVRKWGLQYGSKMNANYINTETVEVLTEWLTDAACESISDELSTDRRWVMDIMYASRGRPQGSWPLLEEVALAVARRWILVDGEFDSVETWQSAFSWLSYYRKKVIALDRTHVESCLTDNVTKAQSIFAQTEGDYYHDTAWSLDLLTWSNWKEIRSIYCWVSSRLLKELGYQTMHYGLAKTLLWLCPKKSESAPLTEAISLLEDMSVGPLFADGWKVQLSLAIVRGSEKSYPSTYDPATAIEDLNQLQAMSRQDESSLMQRVYWKVTQLLADLHFDSGQFGDAKPLFDQIVNRMPFNASTLNALIS